VINVNYNPDVLSCLANLSNDEVFTPPNLVNEMLDMLPNELFQNTGTTFLDPVAKSGVFLREITKRLNDGLKDKIPDQQERINHIFTKQIFGIAITELTSLLARRSTYCSKYANGEYSVCTDFQNEEGNIKFDHIQHTWQDGKCTYCGASESEYSRSDDLETYAYQFIHTDKPQNIFNMKFDVIIGNPPYQLSDGGHGRSAKPIYHKFIDQAIKMNPRFISMIIPARWYAGGKGLDEFRESMLNDDRVRKLVDNEKSSNVFPGVDIAGGICYFLWDRDNRGPCEITNQYDNNSFKTERALNEFNVLIRHGLGVSIVKKVSEVENPKYFLNKVVSPRKPFDLPTNYLPNNSGIPCHFTQKIGLKYAKTLDYKDKLKIKDKWKLLIPRSPIAGQTDFSKPVGFYYDGNVKIAKPGEICTESWLVACSFPTKHEVVSFKSYLFTKIVRFLLLQTVVSQDIPREKFIFIPHLEKYNIEFTDDILRERWKITDDEWSFIDSKIKSL
jgi:site-specific DNA-methyltransferase (adenine-specific)